MPNFFIWSVVKQINYLETVILHAEGLSQTLLGLPPRSARESGEATLHLCSFFLGEKGNLSPFDASENSRSFPACHAAGSMQPSMVLDRTMFHLYCSTTWLDQAQRKTPQTARVRVSAKERGALRGSSTEKHKLKVHGELLSTPPMQKGAGYQRSSCTLQLQEHPGAQSGLVYKNRARANPETELIRQKIRPKGCKRLLAGRMHKFHHILNAQATLLFISYLLSPGVSFQYKCRTGLLHLFKCNLRNTVAYINNMAELWH